MSVSTIGNRLDNDGCLIQSDVDRPNTLTSGHRACQGCGEALAARIVVDAAYRESNGKIAVVNATGCLEVFSCSYPENAWNIAWIHSLFGNAPAVASGVAAAFRRRGEHDVRVISQGGDGSTSDIGFACLSGMFERNDDVMYVCYDNNAYMNTGVQRSSATPPFARTATTLPSVKHEYWGSEIHMGKNVPEIAMAHGIPYVATASISNVADLELKIRKAIKIRGARYIHVQSPCPLGWGFPSSESIAIARLSIQCGLYPLFEAENGVCVSSTAIDNLIPVEAYLKTQRRFAHIFLKGLSNKEIVDQYQKIANRNIEKYRLILER